MDSAGHTLWLQAKAAAEAEEQRQRAISEAHAKVCAEHAARWDASEMGAIARSHQEADMLAHWPSPRVQEYLAAHGGQIYRSGSLSDDEYLTEPELLSLVSEALEISEDRAALADALRAVVQ